MQEIIVASFTLVGSSLATYLSHRERKSKGCILWVQHEGKRKQLLLQHNNGNNINLLPEWEEADILWCCHPTTLPRRAREKHLAPNWRGTVRVRWMEKTNSIHLITKKEDIKCPKHTPPKSCSAALQR